MVKKRLEAGFTLIEVLVAMALVTLISLVVLGALGPWMGLKQSIDTERKLQDIKQGLASHYEMNAMAIELQPGGTFGLFVSSTTEGEGSCVSQEAAFQKVSSRFSESAQQLFRDGYANPWCVLVSGALSENRDGVVLWYRNIAMVSSGRDGKLDAETKLDAAGNLVTGGDDTGVIISGFDIQRQKLKETMRRMNRIASMYETYFTTRFLAYPDRDITRYYFSSQYDVTGTVGSTGGNWVNTAVALAPIGVSNMDAVSAWELSNDIQTGNANESVGSTAVRSPQTSGTGTLPYTALLRARVPAPSGQEAYATQVVVGNY